jgi:4-hydroxy-3-polyprenylbenzoate decarboxylase
MRRFIVAITGASGVIYGIKLVEELLRQDCEIHLIISEAAYLVIEHEMPPLQRNLFYKTLQEQESQKNLYLYKNTDIAAPIASGSFIIDAMVIIPCSMSTLATVSHGLANTLIARAADVVLKERRQLIIVPRETPFNTIQLRNMLLLSEMGVTILPAMPAFYHHPVSLDDIISFVVGKTLDQMRIEHNLYKRYEG